MGSDSIDKRTKEYRDMAKNSGNGEDVAEVADKDQEITDLKQQMTQMMEQMTQMNSIIKATAQVTTSNAKTVKTLSKGKAANRFNKDGIIAPSPREEEFKILKTFLIDCQYLVQDKQTKTDIAYGLMDGYKDVKYLLQVMQNNRDLHSRAIKYGVTSDFITVNTNCYDGTNFVTID